jgi:molybdopterin-guanine dinucleotide biosynthesis protein MobB
MNPFCIVGIAGYSGAGKTTLIEKILPVLKGQGLAVGIIKHIHHDLTVDIKGKDTDRFYRAGADVVYAHDQEEGFLRFRANDGGMVDIPDKFSRGLDLIIVEGHKDYIRSGIWLQRDRSKNMEVAGKTVILRNDPQYIRKVLDYILKEIKRHHDQRVVGAGLLIGGNSERMGRPKALLEMGGKTLAEKAYDTLSKVAVSAILLGSGPLPESLAGADRLPDVSHCTGPLAGMVSAFRWEPERAWIISSVDMPLMQEDALEWLLEQRKPGVWAVLPKIESSSSVVETTGALYEPLIFDYIDSLSGRGILKLQEIGKHPKVLTPLVPDSLARAWRNVNTPAEWEDVLALSTQSLSS